MAEKFDGRISLHIAGIDGLTEGFAAQMPASSVELLDAIGARLAADIDKKELALVLT